MNPKGHKVRILIADDHRLFREGLRELLDELPDYVVVGEAADGRETLRLVKELKPDLLLLDLQMKGLGGMEMLAELGGSQKQTHIIIVTVAVEKPQISEAFRLGVRGLILKDCAADILLACIRTVLGGKYWILREAASDLSSFAHEHGSTARTGKTINRYSLTGRELEILASIVAGRTNREIAHKFSISEQTVKHHLTHIFDKVGVYNRLELALFAIHHGLIGRNSAPHP